MLLLSPYCLQAGGPGVTKEFFQAFSPILQQLMQISKAPQGTMPINTLKNAMPSHQSGLRAPSSKVALRSFLDAWNNDERLFVYDEQQLN